MAREILFKAKKIDNGEWVEGYYAMSQNTEGITHWILEPIGEMHKIDENTICQYTGLTDKNGNKIWENDIVSFTHSKYVLFYKAEYKRNYAIEFVNTYNTYGLRFRNKSIHFPCKFSTLRMHDVEVIGNIFDNPELLKGE